MATATVARPSQALRTRRDAPRPNLPTKRASAMDGSEPASKKRKMDEPYVRTKDYILRKFAGKPPSLTVQIHPNYFKFDGQEGSFTYDSPMVGFLKSLRKQEVPADMIEALLSGNVPFYDGCLIVEVHNHRSANAKNQSRHDSATGDQIKFSMHNYNNYVTPSGLVGFPKKAKENEVSDKSEAATKQEKSGDDKDKDDDGPHISTIVMFPTPLSQHREMLLLANTPASEIKSKKKSADGSTTPSLSIPPTPLVAATRTAGQEDKKALEEQDYYQFQADVLLTTEPVLYLEPVKNPTEAQRVLDMLKHPLHSDPPPSPKTRKRTTAELAADDAQAAEAERRMLIMDERKTTAQNAADGAATSQALGLNRFKTLQMVREKLDEAERQKKEEQEQAQAQRKQEEAAASAAQAQKQAQAEQQRKLMNARQHEARLQHQQRMQQQQMQQQAALMAQQQNHAHPQQSSMMNQQNNFQQQNSMAQSSPVVRQQTPMVNNSSPMVAQNGFSMAATSSQQAGSPPRPTSAAIPNPNVAMARQVSQQQHASRNGTPQMAQGTPNMPGAMPNRQVNQTPRIPHGSPAPGTPAATNLNMASMPMQTPGNNTMTPEQFAMLQTRQQMMQNGGTNAGSPGQNPALANMTPEQIQQIQQQQRHRQQQLMIARAQAAAQNSNNPQTQQALAQRAFLLQQQQQQQAMQQRMLQQQQQQNNAGQAGSPHPGNMQMTPQMGHAHPQQGQNQGDMNQGQQMTPQQQAQRHQQQQAQFRQAHAALQNLVQQYNGLQNIPQQVISGLPTAMQMLIVRQKQQNQQTARAQQMAMRAQQAQNAGQAVAGTTSTPDPEYMQTLRNHQSMLAQQQQQGGQMNGMSMTHNMNFGNLGGNQQFQGGQGHDLRQQFQAMQAALDRSQQGGGMGQ